MALTKPQKPSITHTPPSMERRIAVALWAHIVVPLARLVRRHPYGTVWSIVLLGLYGSHAWVLFGVVLAAPLVISLWYRCGPRFGLLEHFAPHLLDRRDAVRTSRINARRIAVYRRQFEEHAPYVLPSNNMDELAQPVAYGEHKFGWWVELVLPRGQTPKDIEGCKDALQHALGVRRIDVESPSPGRVKLSMFLVDPFAAPQDSPAIPQLQPYQLGTYEDGSPLLWDPALAPHLIVVGKTGAGKSSVLLTLLLSLPSDWEITLCDFGKVEFGQFPVGGKIVAVATSLEDIVEVWEDAEAEMHRRLDLMVARDVNNIDKLPVSIRPPHRVILFDEAMVALSAGDNTREVAKVCQKIVGSMGQVALLGRKCGMHSVTGLQQPEAVFFGGSGRRSAYSPIALRHLDTSGCTMAFGNADASTLFDGQPGHGVVLGVDGSDMPRRFRAEWIRDEKAARRIICGR